MSKLSKMQPPIIARRAPHARLVWAIWPPQIKWIAAIVIQGLALSLLLGFSSTAHAAGQAAQTGTETKSKPTWSKRWINTESGEVLALTLEGLRFEFPKRLVRPPYRLDRPRATIWANWPEMTRWPRKRSVDREIAEDNSDQLFASYGLGNFPNQMGQIASGLASGTLKPPVQDPKLPGLDCYPRAATDKIRYCVSRDGQLIDANGSSLLIKCNATSTFVGYRYFQCEVGYQLAPGVTIRYRYYDKHLSDWKAIHEALTKFLVSTED